MEHKVLRKAEKLQKSHTKKQRLYRGLSILAAGVVFCTTYALILPAITLDNNTICGLDEHEHTDKCYTATGSWRCMDDATLTEADYVAHIHSESCTTEDGTMICPLAEWPNVVEPHQHTDECYRLTPHEHGEECMVLVPGELICTEPVSDGHRHDETCLGEEPMLTCELPAHEFHTDNCYDSNGNIICGMENHVHNAETCYTLTPVNVCGLDESEGHHHGGTCYAYVTAPGCGMEEGSEVLELVCEKPALHTHTDECYTEGALTCKLPVVILHEHEDCYVPGEPTLTCGLEEHEHKDECYETTADPTILVNGTAESAMPIADFDLTGKWADDLVTVAQSQGGKVSANYGAWYTETYGEAADNAQAFVSWCLEAVGITSDIIPYSIDAESFYTEAMEMGILQTDGKPTVGDIVIDDYGDVYMTGIYTSTYGFYSNVTYGDLNGTVGEEACMSPIAWISIDALYDKYHPQEPPVEEEGEGIADGAYNLEVLRALLNSTWFEDHYTHLATAEENNVMPLDNGATDTPVTDTATDKTNQIDYTGDKSENSEDKVYVSKTIAKTDNENVFDITLRVETDEELSVDHRDPDMAVVIVVDISGTMMDGYDGEDINVDPSGSLSSEAMNNMKFTGAWQAADKFIESFAKTSQGISKLGIVAFNTDAYQVHEMADLAVYSPNNDNNNYRDFMETSYKTLKSIMKGANTEGYPKPNSYTNMEGGLKMAQDMLKGEGNKNKYVILISDGLPTTYLPASGYEENADSDFNSGYSKYNGYPPVTKESELTTPKTDGVFSAKVYYNDSYVERRCGDGVNYSDVGAIKARRVAEAMKSNSVDIYTVGIGLSSFTGTKDLNQKYNGLTAEELIVNQLKRAKGLLAANSTCVVDFYKDYNGNEIVDGQHDGAETLANKMEVLKAESFVHWLRCYIGSGDQSKNETQHKADGDKHFIEGNSAEALASAFKDIFGELSEKSMKQWTDAWIVTDPVPDAFDYVQLVSDAKADEWITTSTNPLQWQLQKAAEITDPNDKMTNYAHAYKITYRVRLKNEAVGFEENKIYETNGTTQLTYRVTTQVDGTTTGFKDGTITFPIPQVHGYLVDLTFTKVCEGTDTGIPGAEFTLTHDPTCTLCKLTEENQDYWSCLTKEATSDDGGTVQFSNIPSGHTYILVETEAPVGYTKSNKTYTVTASYDKITVTESDGNGNTITWGDEDYKISNSPKPELPNTGGGGTKRYVSVGVVLMTTSLLWYAVRRKQRE